MDEIAASFTTEASHIPYRAPRWLPGGQLQTLYAYYHGATPIFRYRRERWETPDGDFIDLDWVEPSPVTSNFVVLFHGLEGSSWSHYAVGLMNELTRRGWLGVVANFRGCSGEINRLPRSYHSGDSAEVHWILTRLKKMHPCHRIFTVGISLGGNVLLKWLGEQGDRALGTVEKAVAVSSPVDLAHTAARLDHGLNKIIYTRSFLRSIKLKALAKIHANGLNLDGKSIRRASTFREIDDLFTAPIHGFKDAVDYWTRSSAKPWLKLIKIPTLLIQARNDPFLTRESFPDTSEVSPSMALEYTVAGGHVGFVAGKFPGSLGWLPSRIVGFCRARY